VAGRWPNRRKTINAPLKKNELQSGERIVRVSPEGKDAQTEFSVIRRFNDCTLVEARPITGRTHQIRVHAQYAGHGLIGDEKYGDESLNKRMREKGIKRLFLHAASLSFMVPASGKRISVEAPLSPELLVALDGLDSSLNSSLDADDMKNSADE
jgi:23S rRNA pseudouridine955/2504/2580 synthase